METLLDVQNLGISFGDLRAVNNFSINIGKEQLYGLIGPNGCRKNNYIQPLDRCLQTRQRKDNLRRLMTLRKIHNRDKQIRNSKNIPEYKTFFTAYRA